MQVVRQRRSGDADALLQPADRQAGITGADQRPIDLQTGRVAKRLELGVRQ